MKRKQKAGRRNGLREYELYVPLVTEGKVRCPARKLEDLKRGLTARFGGLTHFPQKSKGEWKIGNVTFHDEVVILRVLTRDSAAVRTFWKQLKSRMEREWKQKEILIVARKVEVV